MPTTLAREVVQEPERRHRAAAVGTPAARQPVGAMHSNGELARLARAGGSPPNAALHAWSNRVARASLAVTHPDDPVEREAEQVASDVVHRRTVVAQAAAPADPPIGRSRSDGASAPGARAARDPATGPAPPAPAAEAGSVVEHAEEIAEGGQVEVPQSVASLIASPGTGVPLEPGVQARVAPVLGADLSSVRVHQGPDASAAAAALQARAFTVGADIFLGEGESADGPRAHGARVHARRAAAGRRRVPRRGRPPVAGHRHARLAHPRHPVDPRVLRRQHRHRQRPDHGRVGHGGPAGVRREAADVRPVRRGIGTGPAGREGARRRLHDAGRGPRAAQPDASRGCSPTSTAPGRRCRSPRASTSTWRSPAGTCPPSSTTSRRS